MEPSAQVDAGDDRTVRQEFDRENLPLCARAGRALGWLGIATAVPLAAIESAGSPEHEAAIAWLRRIAIALSVVQIAVLRSAWGSRHPRGVILVASNLAGILVLAMMSLSGVSHELRTPLNVILGYAEIARDAGLDAAERAEAVSAIEDAGRILHDMLSDTLEVSRLHTAIDVPSWETISLRDLWADVRRQCARNRHPRVSVEWSLQTSEALSLRTDRRRLVTILRNLVGNAVKFTPEGAVRVSAAAEFDRVVFRVADSGIGIAASEHRRIFDPFYQAGGAASGHSSGVGLGLYIVKRYAAQIGAAISLRSTPGVGTEFTVGLPYAESPPSRLAESV